MPELPEVEALAHYLREHGRARVVSRIDVVSPTVLKTVTPAWTQLHGREVTDVRRYGKYLDVACDDLHLVVHLARAGWLRWVDALPAVPPKPGKGPLAARVHLSGPGFDVTEAGTRKRLAIWIVRDPREVSGIARLGPDALAVDEVALRALFVGHSERVKTALTNQALIAGIGNAYSDEILHVARISPYAITGSLDDDSLTRLAMAIRDVLREATDRSVGQTAARLKGEKRAGLRVHNRAGLPCPVCGDIVREVSFADKALQYCPRCQTGGKLLADRRMSRLLK